jgi:hypothetical protein
VVVRIVLPRRAAGRRGAIKAVDEDGKGGVSAAAGDVKVPSVPDDEVRLAAPGGLQGAADGRWDDPDESDGNDEARFTDSKLVRRRVSNVPPAL